MKTINEVSPDSAWWCAVKCAAPCLAFCLLDVASPIMDAIGTVSFYAQFHG